MNPTWTVLQIMNLSRPYEPNGVLTLESFELGAGLKPLSLLLRQLRLEDLAHAVAQDAGQRKL